ncbi:MAG: hypothetical protein M9947_08075 [Thermomicrobiales bacterium]|nr:hypothetical protein [Thermomicrobiales bacterium]
MRHWDDDLSGYFKVQSTRPQTVAYGLTDLPPHHPETSDWFRDRQIDLDRVIANITIYWLTNTVASSILCYYEDMHAGEWPEYSTTPDRSRQLRRRCRHPPICGDDEHHRPSIQPGGRQPSQYVRPRAPHPGRPRLLPFAPVAAATKPIASNDNRPGQGYPGLLKQIPKPRRRVARLAIVALGVSALRSAAGR